jgi:hypothetical protein
MKKQAFELLGFFGWVVFRIQKPPEAAGDETLAFDENRRSQKTYFLLGPEPDHPDHHHPDHPDHHHPVSDKDKKNNKIAAEITVASAWSIAYVMVLLCTTDHIMSLCTIHNIRNAMSVSIAKG